MGSRQGKVCRNDSAATHFCQDDVTLVQVSTAPFGPKAMANLRLPQAAVIRLRANQCAVAASIGEDDRSDGVQRVSFLEPLTICMRMAHLGSSVTLPM